MGLLTNWLYYPEIDPKQEFKDFGYFRDQINKGIMNCPHCGGRAELMKVADYHLAAKKKCRVSIVCIHGFKPKCNRMVPAKVVTNHQFRLADISKLIAIWNHPLIGYFPLV